MLKRIALKFGPNGFDSELSLEPVGVTIFVGPNNSGKSLVLREVQTYAESGPQAGSKIVSFLEPWFSDPESTRNLLKSRELPFGSEQPRSEGQMQLLKMIPGTGGSAIFNISGDELLRQLDTMWRYQRDNPNVRVAPNWQPIWQHYVGLFTMALDGRTRFALTDVRDAGDLQSTPSNHLAALFKNDIARGKVRTLTNEAFGFFFTIDPTFLGKLRIRMADRPPTDSQEEQAVDQRARDYHGAARDIAGLSDGIKAFTGIVSTIISADYRVILVDEPEAFLHPPLARKLGNTVAGIATERSATLLASTHSPHFLMGCIDSGIPLNIVRLTYSAGKPTARALPSAKLNVLMRDPLLRSTNVLNALFHSCAVVCEADRDRAFYEEINTRLAAAKQVAVGDGLFLNAQNKQTIRRIVQPLREMGVPAAAIVDIDIIKGTDLKDLLAACFVPPVLIHSLTTLRGDVEAAFKLSELDMKVGGIALLGQGDQQAAASLISQLRDYGIFVVPSGEVESWLSYLEVRTSKEDWLPAMFERMRSDPSEADYVRPKDGDVWEFLRRVAGWIANTTKLGMPAS